MIEISDRYVCKACKNFLKYRKEPYIRIYFCPCSTETYILPNLATWAVEVVENGVAVL